MYHERNITIVDDPCVCLLQHESRALSQHFGARLKKAVRLAEEETKLSFEVCLCRVRIYSESFDSYECYVIVMCIKFRDQ